MNPHRSECLQVWDYECLNSKNLNEGVEYMHNILILFKVKQKFNMAAISLRNYKKKRT